MGSVHGENEATQLKLLHYNSTTADHFGTSIDSFFSIDHKKDDTAFAMLMQSHDDLVNITKSPTYNKG